MPGLDLEAQRLAQLASAEYVPDTLRASVAGGLVRLALQLDSNAARLPQD
jgi:hypothetical protein